MGYFNNELDTIVIEYHSVINPYVKLRCNRTPETRKDVEEAQVLVEARIEEVYQRGVSEHNRALRDQCREARDIVFRGRMLVAQMNRADEQNAKAEAKRKAEEDERAARKAAVNARIAEFHRREKEESSILFRIKKHLPFLSK